VDPDPVSFFGETETFGSDGVLESDADASGGEARLYAIGGDTLNFNLDYKIPSDRARVAIRYRIPEGKTQAAFDLQIDGTVVESIGSGIFTNTSYNWFQAFALSSPLSPGSHTASIELGSGGEDIVVDALVVYDDRYSFTFDNTVGADGYLFGPESKPEFVEIETDDGLTVFQFTGARFEAVYDDTSGNQRVGVSNDQGSTFTYTDNSESVETDFASGSAQIRGSLGFDRYGSRSTQSPTTGFKGQTVSSITLKGDIEETALLINQDYDARAMEVLQDIANYADLPFEYRKEGGTPSVEMSKPGQRTTSDVPTPSKYEYSKTVEEQVGRVVVKGGRQQQREEEFTADHGTAVSLEHGNIDHGTETVYEPSSGESFEEGADYSLSPGVETDTGSITTLSGGSMSDGTTYAIDYNYHEEGEWTDASAGPDPKPLIETIPGLTTQRSCEQAAVILGRQLDEPLEKATVTIPTAEAGFNILDAQQFSELPSDTFWEIQSVTTTPRQTEFNLGSRKQIRDAVNSIQRRLSSAAKRT
jgi:hypothetical protein